MRNPVLKRSLTFCITAFLFLAITQTTIAQLFSDSTAINLVRKGISNIYNREYTKAEDVLNEINARYPGHPATYLYKAILIYYKEYPLIPLNSEFKGFENQLRASMRLCEATNGWLNDPEKLLIDFCSRGLLMLCYTENGMSNEVIPIALTSYKCVRKSFQYKSVYPDFCFFTGLYNYYREAYPEHHPVYRPIAMLFPHGDRATGLKDLQNAAENAIVLKAEAYSILSWIYIEYEKKYPIALEYSRTITGEYPANLLFRGEYLKNLLLLKEYDEAENIIGKSDREQHAYFQGQLAYFKGIIQEKKYRNYELAAKYFQDCSTAMKPFGTRGKEYTDYSAGGLKRIKTLQN